MVERQSAPAAPATCASPAVVTTGIQFVHWNTSLSDGEITIRVRDLSFELGNPFLHLHHRLTYEIKVCKTEGESVAGSKENERRLLLSVAPIYSHVFLFIIFFFHFLQRIYYPNTYSAHKILVLCNSNTCTNATVSLFTYQSVNTSLSHRFCVYI
jgi:hypothetical protein